MTKSEVFAANPTRFWRRRWVAWGADEPHQGALELGRVPAGVYQAARVIALPFSRGPLEIDMPDVLEPFLDPLVAQVLGQHQLTPILRVDGNMFEFRPKAFEVDTPFFKRLLWAVDTPTVHARLWTDLGQQDQIMPFVCRVYGEDRQLLEGQLRTVDLLPGTPLVWVEPWPHHKIVGGRLGDGSGFTLRGSLLFTLPGDIPDTVLAEQVWPLVACGRRNFVSPPEVSEAVWAGEIYGGDIAHRPYQEPTAYCGALNMPWSEQTGEHPGFGVRGLYYPIVMASPARRCEALPGLAMMADRHAARPIRFFDLHGEEAVPAPDCVTYGERPHRDNNVSPNKLGRAGQKGEWPDGWSGQDREHDGNNHLFEDAINRFDPASLYELLWKARHFRSGRTLPSEKPGWSTNGKGSGRGQARSFLAAAQQYLATGEEWIKDHLSAVLEETVRPFELQQVGAYVAETVISGDLRLFNGARGHVVWQDALVVPTWFLIGRLLRKDWLVERALELGVSLVERCFYPSGEAHIAQAILWDLVEARGGLLQPSDFANREQIWPSNEGTAYTLWSIPLLEVVRSQGDSMAMAHANHLLQQIGKVSWFYERYRGVI